MPLCNSNLGAILPSAEGAKVVRNWVKTALFVSVFSPAVLSLALAKFLENSRLSIDILSLTALGLLGLASLKILLHFFEAESETFTISVKEIERNDALMLSIVSTYVIPFFTASRVDVAVILGLIILGAVVLWMMSAIPPHPMLRIFGYRFYKIKSASGVVYTLISRRDIPDPGEVKSVKRISGAMLMEIRREA